MESKLHTICYVSTAVKNISKYDLTDILHHSRKNNAKVDITGILLFGKNRFLQILEGEENALKKLYENIRLDERHQNLLLLQDTALINRRFAMWSMAFIDVENPSSIHLCKEEIQNTETLSGIILQEESIPVVVKNFIKNIYDL